MRFERLAAGALLAIGAGHAAGASATPRIAVVQASALGPFQQASRAIAETLRADPAQPEILTFDLEGDASRAGQVVAEVRSAHPTVVVSVGSLATTAVLAAGLDVPIVFSMVLYPEESGFLAKRARGVTGVALDVPLDVQLTKIRLLVPDARRVGVLYNPAETGRIVAAARTAATGLRLELVPREVPDATKVVEALADLAPRVDVLWSVADSHVFNSQTTSGLILEALRRRLPVVGLSTTHVRAGTLAALVVDYAEVGRQTGEIALRVIAGARPDTIPFAAPRKLGLALNLHTAQRLGITLDPTLVRDAVEVVR